MMDIESMDLEQLLERRTELNDEIAALQEADKFVSPTIWLELKQVDRLISQEICPHKNLYRKGQQEWMSDTGWDNNIESVCLDCEKEFDNDI